MTPVKSKTSKKSVKKQVAKGPAKGKAAGQRLSKQLDQDSTSHALVPAALVQPVDRDLMQLYMREVAKAPLLTPQEERALAIRVFDHKDAEALRKLVQSNLRFVLKIAFEYARYGARILDLVQEGNLGLMKAVQDFNPYKDVRLTTYAVWWIRSYIQDFLIRNWSVVRVGTTAAQKKLFYNLKKEVEKFEREGLKVEPKAIAMNLGVEEDEVKMMQERMGGGDLSLSTPVGGSDSDSPQTILSKVSDPSPLQSTMLEDQEQGDLFKKALGEFQKTELDERELVIFKERLLSENPRTLIEIGDEYGISKERARQIEERIKDKLKAFLNAKYPDISLG
jgi:RNA polymerase sigma-32 factor